MNFLKFRLYFNKEEEFNNEEVLRKVLFDHFQCAMQELNIIIVLTFIRLLLF